jgi:hypothetical protein
MDRLQLAFDEMTQQPEKLLTIGLRQICPETDDRSAIGWGEAALGKKLDMTYHLPHALMLRLTVDAQPR